MGVKNRGKSGKIRMPLSRNQGFETAHGKSVKEGSLVIAEIGAGSSICNSLSSRRKQLLPVNIVQDLLFSSRLFFCEAKPADLMLISAVFIFIVVPILIARSLAAGVLLGVGR